ncbi:hypothetical protein EYF80_032427 [Liparis tanakae]|uniref:Uncharacterized protein n=1 Tax=Liparis tanakae TaxID=230148 RepID=A0A4Z2GVI0_9TELE|nr:hypothetical protein EYF80_032427 [Liparis tanakae]
METSTLHQMEAERRSGRSLNSGRSPNRAAADGQVIGEEEEPQDWSSSLNREDPDSPHITEVQEDPEPPHITEVQEDPEPPHIKEEQEDPEYTHNKEVNEDPEPPHIKEEQEELWTNQEVEQLEGLEEAGIGFIFTIVKSEDEEEEEEEEAQSSHLHQRLTEHNETAAGGEDYRGPEPDWKCSGCWVFLSTNLQC